MIEIIERLRTEGWTPTKLASELSLATPDKAVTPQAISQWKQVPHDRVLDVERITGISRHELRPDLSRIFVEPAPSEKEDAA